MNIKTIYLYHEDILAFQIELFGAVTVERTDKFFTFPDVLKRLKDKDNFSIVFGIDKLTKVSLKTIFEHIALCLSPHTVTINATNEYQKYVKTIEKAFCSNQICSYSKHIYLNDVPFFFSLCPMETVASDLFGKYIIQSESNENTFVFNPNNTPEDYAQIIRLINTTGLSFTVALCEDERLIKNYVYIYLINKIPQGLVNSTIQEYCNGQRNKTIYNFSYNSFSLPAWTYDSILVPLPLPIEGSKYVFNANVEDKIEDAAGRRGDCVDKIEIKKWKKDSELEDLISTLFIAKGFPNELNDNHSIMLKYPSRLIRSDADFAGRRYFFLKAPKEVVDYINSNLSETANRENDSSIEVNIVESDTDLIELTCNVRLNKMSVYLINNIIEQFVAEKDKVKICVE